MPVARFGMTRWHTCGCSAWAPYEVLRDQIGRTVEWTCYRHLYPGFRSWLLTIHPDLVYHDDTPPPEIRQRDPMRYCALTFAPAPKPP